MQTCKARDLSTEWLNDNCGFCLRRTFVEQTLLQYGEIFDSLTFSFFTNSQYKPRCVLWWNTDKFFFFLFRCCCHSAWWIVCLGHLSHTHIQIIIYSVLFIHIDIDFFFVFAKATHFSSADRVRRKRVKRNIHTRTRSAFG